MADLLGLVAQSRSVDTDIESRTIRKILLRTIPFLAVSYFFAYLDRVNIGFAALAMNADLGFSPTVFSTGAGIFFIGYFLFEIPSNMALVRFGAGRWISRIMISWGCISVLMVLIQGATSFYMMRFALGVAEAGFFPGVLLYLTYWFPAKYRARIASSFLIAVPLSSAIGSPISGLILELDGALGIRGWQWLFLLEGVPSILLGVAAFRVLADGPEKAKWLSSTEREWLKSELTAERRSKEAVRHLTFWQALRNFDLWAMSGIYFGLVAAMYGVGLWLPQIIKGFGLSNTQTGFVVALPYLFSVVAMVMWAMDSDRRRERIWHVVLPLMVVGGGLVGAAWAERPEVLILMVIVASVGMYCAHCVFWTLPPALLTGAAAAGGIAFVNSIGNLAGFVGPYVIGWVKETTGEVSAGLLITAAMPVISAMLTLALGKVRAGELAAADAKEV